MTVSHGMNIAAVSAFGKRLQHEFSKRLEQMTFEMERMVQESAGSWIGPDADQFRGWWPQKRAALAAMSTDLYGFGQSALNNATEQQEASGGGGRTVISPGVPLPGRPGTPSPVIGRVLPEGDVGAARPGPLPGSGRSEEEVLRDFDQRLYEWDKLRYAKGELKYQCVTWAWYRMWELGYNGPRPSGNGHEIAGLLGGTTSTLPVAGAVLSWGPTDHNEYGHVAVAEEVYVDDQGRLTMRISEMNVERTGGAYRDEYRDTQLWYYDADAGEWMSDGGKRSSITIANPEYGESRV